LGDSGKYSYLYNGCFFEIPRARGLRVWALCTGNPKDRRVIMIGILRHGGFSRGDGQKSESTNKLMTVLTTAESRVHDKH